MQLFGRHLFGPGHLALGALDRIAVRFRDHAAIARLVSAVTACRQWPKPLVNQALALGASLSELLKEAG